MKSLLLTVAFSAMAVVGNAQSLVATNTLNNPVQKKVMAVAPQTRNFQVTKVVAAPAKSPSSGVGYRRPEGTLYSEYTFSGDEGVTYDEAALMVPSLTGVKFEHYCAGVPTWTMGTQEMTNVDAAGNLTVNLPVVDPSSENNYGGYYAPTCTYKNEDFNLTDVMMVGNDYLPISNVNPTAVTFYTGFTEGPAWGTGSVLEDAIAKKDTIPFGTFQSFEKPVSPLSLQSVHLECWSDSKTPLGGKQLTAKLYKLPTEEGAKIDLDDPVATFVCKENPEMKSFTGTDSYYGQMYFYNYVDDPIFGETREAVNIDYAFCLLFEGYNQEGVDARFFLVDQGEDSNEVPYALSTRIATTIPAESGEGTETVYYHWAGNYQGTNYMYAMPIGLDVLYDVADVLETGIDSEGNKYTGLNKLHLSDDGQTCYVESDETKTATVGIVYTVFSWYDDADDAQYEFTDCPDWLTLEVESQGYSDDAAAFVNYVNVTAEALPADTDGRTASVRVTSSKGAKSEARLYFAQGDATGIKGVESVAKQTSTASYNVAGQKVAADFKGLVIKNGKKMLNK